MNSEMTQKPEKQRSSKWDILQRYDETERARVEKIKKEMRDYGELWSSSQVGKKYYKREGVNSTPSIIKKIGRAVLDLAHITIPAVEEHRIREAIPIALEEYIKEEEHRKQQLRENEVKRIMKTTQESIGKEVQEIVDEEEREKRAILSALVHNRDRYKANKKEAFQKQRVQELIERDFNSRLLSVDELDEQVASENSEVELSTIDYEGKEIQVYTLKGYPFSMLSTAIDYRRINDENHIGAQTSKALVNDPSIWAQNEEEAKKADGYGTRYSNARGNVISTSYIKSDRTMERSVIMGSNMRVHTVYGFSKIRAGSIVDIYYGDGGTPNMVDKDYTWLSEHNLDAIRSLEDINNNSSYNEILLHRYDELGNPILPDYMVTMNGQITEAIKRHAAFFKIPIINIEKQYYAEKSKPLVEKALDSINSESEYEQIVHSIQTIKDNRDTYYIDFHAILSIGIGEEKTRLRIYENDTELEKRIIKAETIELEKRIEFIQSELESRISQLKRYISEGQPCDELESLLKKFELSVYDAKSDSCTYEVGRLQYEKRQHPASRFSSCNNVEIKMVFGDKGHEMEINTKIYDGEHHVLSDTATNYDSTIYNRIAPLAEEYFALLEENKKLKTSQTSV